MKGGAENRKKTILAGVLGALALCCAIYMYNALFGGSSASTPAATVPTNAGKKSSTSSSLQTRSPALSTAPGVAATKMASTSSSLDPTLDESAMLRTEMLVYSGSGRNIFSSTYTEVAIPKGGPPARPGPAIPQVTTPVGPAPLPTINLRFFGTATRVNGAKQAFLLNGEDVYLASVGDIVARKYKIVSIGTSNIQVEDLQNNNTQTLPLLN